MGGGIGFLELTEKASYRFMTRITALVGILKPGLLKPSEITSSRGLLTVKYGYLASRESSDTSLNR
jgi:predicted component of type VI protein secretion system